MDDIKSLASKTSLAIECLTVYRMVFNDHVLQHFRDLLSGVLADDPFLVRYYHQLMGHLLEEGCCSKTPGVSLFQDYLLEKIISSENSFTLACDNEKTADMNSLLLEAVKNDLKLLQVIYSYNLTGLGNFLKSSDDQIEDFAFVKSLCLENCPDNKVERWPYPELYYHKKEVLKRTLASADYWPGHFSLLSDFYREAGSGLFGRYWAFKWNSSAAQPCLRGVNYPDQIRLKDLVGYRDQQAVIVRNTEQFVKGLPANNILLYGDRGTGKSSTIKSLVHLFGESGLRLIEIAKSDLLSLPGILDAVRNRAQRFILFVDDLSFEETETEYKELKALLEGSVEKPPENVLLYATSNRRNLVREYFSDREPDEVGKQDTYQEKLSLVDRFGIKILYPTPDKMEYLQTVEALADRSGINLDRTVLHDLALKWIMWHNARSGRTARQFIDDLKGKMDLAEKDDK